jgi:DNA-binding NtrC family response regulator
MRAMLSYGWPGNVRELAHAVERATLLAEGEVIRSGELSLTGSTASAPQRLEDLSLEDLERLFVTKALERYEGNVSRAAEALGLSRSALYRRLEKHGLSNA